MKREISVNYSRTVNTGSYESFKIGIGTTVEVPEGEDKKVVIEKEYNDLKGIVEQAIREELNPPRLNT